MRPDVVDIDVQLLAHGRQLVREEDVRLFDESVEDGEPVRVREVQPDALLPTVGVLEQDGHATAEPDRANLRQTAHGVAALGVLDLDHVRTPVREDGRGGGDERVLRHLEDADPLHHVRHRSPPLAT